MSNFTFYTIDQAYLDFLRKIDSKVPASIKVGGTYPKPYCGIVLEINKHKYYAPLSSYTIPKKTNFLIKDGEKVISTVRLCFMIPAQDKVLTQINFNDFSQAHKSLLEKEYRYCNTHAKDLTKQAFNVYTIYGDPKNPISKFCCNFKKLEQEYIKY